MLSSLHLSPSSRNMWNGLGAEENAGPVLRSSVWSGRQALDSSPWCDEVAGNTEEEEEEEEGEGEEEEGGGGGGGGRGGGSFFAGSRNRVGME